MTKEEKLIVSAYTGHLMCDFDELHKFIEKILGRPVWTHELADPNVQSQLRNRVRNDFVKLCESDGVVRCKNCIHRPILIDLDEIGGFKFGAPKDDNGFRDFKCPCLNEDDGYYSWMPEDDFFCAYGEKREKKR